MISLEKKGYSIGGLTTKSSSDILNKLEIALLEHFHSDSIGVIRLAL